MKRIITVLVIMVSVFCAGVTDMSAAADKNVRSGSIINMIRAYKVKKGFDVVSVGNLGLGLTKLIAKAAADDPEERMVLDILNHLNKVIVVDYGDTDKETREAFTRKMSDLLADAEKILEVKEEGENINIYGTSSGDGERIEDIVIFVPDNCELICLFGSISIQQISDIVKMSNE